MIKKMACWIFVDLQKAIDTVNHDILISKLEHYGIRGTANSWFSSYLKNRTQFVSIFGYDSSILLKQFHMVCPKAQFLAHLFF